MTLLVDVHCGYHGDLATAWRVGRRWEALHLYWHEEPLSPEHMNGYRTLVTARNMPVTAMAMPPLTPGPGIELHEMILRKYTIA